jgi:hypothetical protein
VFSNSEGEGRGTCGSSTTATGTCANWRHPLRTRIDLLIHRWQAVVSDGCWWLLCGLFADYARTSPARGPPIGFSPAADVTAAPNPLTRRARGLDPNPDLNRREIR